MENRSIEEIYESLREGLVLEESNKFSIDDEGKALWAANKISDAHLLSELRTRALEEQKEKEIEYFEKRIAKYNEEIEKVKKDLLKGTDFLEGLLLKYYYDKKIADSKYQFRHPFVKLSMSKKVKEYIYPDDEMIEYLKENYPEKIKSSFSKADVKTIFKLVDGVAVDQGTGESPSFVKISEKQVVPQFKIDTK